MSHEMRITLIRESKGLTQEKNVLSIKSEDVFLDFFF